MSGKKIDAMADESKTSEEKEAFVDVGGILFSWRLSMVMLPIFSYQLGYIQRNFHPFLVFDGLFELPVDPLLPYPLLQEVPCLILPIDICQVVQFHLVCLESLIL